MLTKIENGVTVECTLQEEAELNVKWAAADAAYEAKVAEEEASKDVLFDDKADMVERFNALLKLLGLSNGRKA